MTSSRYPNFYNVKSNYSNTLSKFYNPVLENIENLNFNGQESHLTIEDAPPLKYDYRRESTVKNLDILLPQLSQKKDKNKKNIIENYASQKIDNTSFQRLENMAFEAKLNSEKKYLEDKLENKKNNKKLYLHEICLIQKEIENLEVEIEFNSNFPTYVEAQNKKKLGHWKNNSNDRKKSKFNDDEMFSYVSMMQKAHSKMEEETIAKLDEIEKKKIKKVQKKEKIIKLEKDIERIRNELKKIKNNLLDHYHQLLIKGRDTRQEGLIWIIREIFLLGSDVKFSHLPTFLDEQCIIYLFNYTHIDMQLHEISEEKEKYKSTVKEKRIAEINNRPTRKKTFKTSIEHPNNLLKLTEETQKTQNNVIHTLGSTINSEDVIEAYKKTKLDSEIYSIRMNTIGSFLNNSNLIDKETEFAIDLIKNLEKKEDELRAYLNDLKKNEMNRLFKEFIRNDYERRFNITKDVVISAMIGEDNASHELSRQMREQKLFQDKIKMCRTFNPSETLALKVTSNKLKIPKFSFR